MMPLCVVFSDHPERKEWCVRLNKGGLPEDSFLPSEWQVAGKLIAWFFAPGREQLKPNTIRAEYEFELFFFI